MAKSIGNIFRGIIYSDGMNPLPAKLVTCIYFLMLFNAMVTTSVFPYLPKLVKSIGVSEVEAGKKVGLIASSMFVGRVLFSFFWGYMADTKGRKRTLIATATCLASATLAFGFTMSFTWAAVSRFLQGCSMGIIVISKSIVSSECDETNSSLGMAIIIGATSTGMIIGPSLGGFLAFPGDLYSGAFGKDSIFTRFGILLPSVILSSGLAICIAVLILVLKDDRKVKESGNKEETSPLISDTNDNSTKYVDSLEERSSINDRSSFYSNQRSFIERHASIISHRNSINNADLDDNHYLAISMIATPRKERYIEIYDDYHEEMSGYDEERKCCSFKDSKIMQLLKTKNCVLASLLYGLYSFIGIGLDELFPLFASTIRQLHGFGFKTSTISVALMSAAAVNLLLQFILLPKLVKFYGPRKIFIGACFLQALVIPIIPLLEQISNRNIFWAELLVTLFILQFTRSSAFLSVNILLNNSVEPHLLGSANGLGITVGTLGRVLSPTVLGATFAWSLKNIKTAATPEAIGFPFNQFFPFFILSFLAILASVLVLFFPASMDKKKERPVQTSENEFNTLPEENSDKKYMTVRAMNPDSF